MRYKLGIIILGFGLMACQQKPKQTEVKPEAEAGKTTEQAFINIGTGGVTGVYYPTGSAICKVVNKKNPNIKCTVEATAASVYNVNALLADKMDLGIAQSDVGYKAMHGQEPFKEKASNLTSIMSIYPESLTLVVRKDSGIKSFADLKGKKVNIGNPGSGTRRTVETLFKACDMKLDALGFQGQLKAAEMPDALRDGKLDAYFYVVGHPTANIKDVATSTDVAVIALDMPCINDLIKKENYFVKTTIPGGLYQGNDEDVVSFGFKATLLASDKLSDEVAYAIVDAVMSDFENFKSLHPAYSHLTEDSVFEGLSLPLHPGVQKYLDQKNKPAV
ncbi:MAG TPA: TAXI family TRAP transporter solute-binding subunit [Oligoflexia bacterium]|nr:TAXI family TRAP transporter solute-binding subunit [Oligoflexia bacterium]HMR25113.1 TAXI family TRAP transporter solute-binding subunit [Oligoflexia bacterium]